MTVTMDKFGRILIPKAVRETHGLKPGDEFEIDERQDGGSGLHLEPKRKYTAVIRRGGILPVVHFVDEHGDSAPPEASWVGAVEAAREERIDRIVDSLS